MTCWLTIGCSTRWPIAPTGPAILTSASHAIDVPSPDSVSVNDVVMSMSAPTPCPFARIDANSGGRSSSFSKFIVILSPPRPSGTFTFAFQWRSSVISKLSTPGISFAISDGSLITPQTVVARGGQLLRPTHLHLDTTSTLARVASGSWSIDQTRCGGLQLS